jgi:Xaa-Pro aminopeptidase
MHMDRINRLTVLARENGCAAVALGAGAALRYVSGLSLNSMERLTLLLLPTDGRAAAMVVPELEVDRVRPILAQHDTRLFAWADASGPARALQQAAAHVCGAASTRPTIAVEYRSMRVMELRALEAAIGELETIDVTPLLAMLRMVKTPDELVAMRRAVDCIETALRSLLPHIRPGITERQLAGFWKSAILGAGAEDESFPCIVASGLANSASPHHQNSTRELQPGDLIVLDGGAVVDGYTSDLTRTVALGEPGPEARQIYELVQQANEIGRQAVRPGITGAEIDQQVREVIRNGGYGDYFIHRTGHGLGMECHELPDIVAGSTLPLPVGTTFTIEPGIYIAGVGGVRIEDDVVVTSTGGESLTTFDRDLIVLPPTAE